MELCGLGKVKDLVPQSGGDVMRKTLIALAGAATIAISALAVPTQAEARNGWVAGAVVGGLALGALAAGAYGPYYGPGPYYYAPRRCWWERQRVWTGYGWGWSRVQVCR
jgi:hypothetical protein